MQSESNENQELNSDVLDLTPDDWRPAVGFFALLFKVDKRVNPTNYQRNNSENDRYSVLANTKEQDY